MKKSILKSLNKRIQSFYDRQEKAIKIMSGISPSNHLSIKGENMEYRIPKETIVNYKALENDSYTRIRLNNISMNETNFNFFNEVVADQIEEIQAILTKKGQEYANEGDRFSNFKRAAELVRTTPEKALLGMRLKHEVSMLDIVDNLDRGVLPTKELLSEKIGDNINYLILLKGLILERIDKAGNK